MQYRVVKKNANLIDADGSSHSPYFTQLTMNFRSYNRVQMKKILLDDSIYFTENHRDLLCRWVTASDIRNFNVEGSSSPNSGESNDEAVGNPSPLIFPTPPFALLEGNKSRTPLLSRDTPPKKRKGRSRPFIEHEEYDTFFGGLNLISSFTSVAKTMQSHDDVNFDVCLNRSNSS